MKVNRTLMRRSRQLHNYAAITLLLLMGFFGVTGLTLNNPQWFINSTFEKDIEFSLNNYQQPQELSFTPAQIQQLEDQLEVTFSHIDWEVDGELAFLDSQMPGGFVSGELDLANGQLNAGLTSYGVWGWLNDLHKGRHTGIVWKWLLDISSLLILIFCLSGLVLILPSRRNLKLSTALGMATAVICGAVLAYF